MNTQAYLIDTNVIIGLEDNRAVQPVFASFISTAARYKADVFVHEAARDDIARDKDAARKCISLSKLDKFQTLGRVRGLNTTDLVNQFGALPRPNDVVDATLLDSIRRGAADFLVTEDRGLHDRARRYSPELGRRVLFVADAVQLLRTTYEPIAAPVRFVEEITANEIAVSDAIFDSLRQDYIGFDKWWEGSCVRERRPCWAVFDNGLAGIIVRKDESATDTDAVTKAKKILKLCTLKVRPENRGIKLGELLLKKAFWFAQINRYDLVYLTVFDRQVALIDLLEYYGFRRRGTKPNGEFIYEKAFSDEPLNAEAGISHFDTDRLNYPRFIARVPVRAFGVPIKEDYHDTLYPDLRDVRQADLFDALGVGGASKRAGNTIRKVYLCRAKSHLGPPGSLLFFYKGVSKNPPSQALTTIGLFEDVSNATSTKDLMHLTGGRSVYSEVQLCEWGASPQRPVRVINYLLAAYLDPPLLFDELKAIGIVGGHPPQSIFEIDRVRIDRLLERVNLGFKS